MINDRDIADKATQSAKYDASRLAQGSVGSGLDGCNQTADMPMRESMIGSLRSRLDRSRRESRKAERLEELLFLLDKNPEIARILDLVDSVGRDY